MLFRSNQTRCYGDVNCGEANLDVQQISSIGTGAEFGFIAGGEGDLSMYDIFVQYREAFIESSDIKPDVLSLSWGGIGPGIGQDVDDILMEFVSVGITVLSATGRK